MNIQTKDLERVALDWAVAKCLGVKLYSPPRESNPAYAYNGVRQLHGDLYLPSTNRAQGWPIIERENISTACRGDGTWFASTPEHYAGSAANATGPTDLIAGLRCFVDSRLGPEVEVPDELVPHLVAQRAAAQEATTQNQSIDRPRG